MLLSQYFWEYCQIPKIEDNMKTFVLDYSIFIFDKQRRTWEMIIRTS